MLTDMPSPTAPLTVAVTTTRVSLATKFRMHRSWPCVAPRSNLRACEQAAKRTRLQTYCSSDRGTAIVAELLLSTGNEALSLSVSLANACLRDKLDSDKVNLSRWQSRVEPPPGLSAAFAPIRRPHCFSRFAAPPPSSASPSIRFWNNCEIPPPPPPPPSPLLFSACNPTNLTRQEQSAAPGTGNFFHSSSPVRESCQDA